MNRVRKDLNRWVSANYLNLIFFNTFLVIIFLLRSAGYFHPFFNITVNFIVMSALMVSVLILGARSRAMFVCALFFWVFAGVIRVFQIEVWAERTAVYAYEALVLGVLILVWERYV